jgi:hypothetical protein
MTTAINFREKFSKLPAISGFSLWPKNGMSMDCPRAVQRAPRQKSSRSVARSKAGRRFRRLG